MLRNYNWGINLRLRKRRRKGETWLSEKYTGLVISQRNALNGNTVFRESDVFPGTGSQIASDHAEAEPIA